MLIPNLFLVALMAQPVPPPAPAAVEPAAVTATPLADTSAAVTAIETGLAAYRKRNYAGAEVAFERALSADPASVAAAYYLGYTIYKRVERRPFHADKARAARLFGQAFAADPSFRPDWGRAAKKK